MNARVRSSSRRQSSLEMLERRALLSAAWSTVDTYAALGGTVTGMAADKAGNVYMSGSTQGSTGTVVFVREKPAGNTAWATIFQTQDAIASETNELAVDAAGDLFLGGDMPDGSGIDAVVREMPAGQSTFSVIDKVPASSVYGLTTDAAGDVYALDNSAIRKLVPGSSGFTATNVYQAPVGFSFTAITAIDSGASAGVYATGTKSSTSSWFTLKSSNGGTTWTQVDQFRYDPASSSGWPQSMIGDAAGNVYVAGWAPKSTITSYDTHNKPVYTNIAHWIVRKSGNGGTSWSIADDFDLSTLKAANAYAMSTDLAGNVYVAGSAYDNSTVMHAIIRSNAGGSWSTSDDFTGEAIARYEGMTTDSAGNLYAAGRGGVGNGQNFFIRSAAGPAPAAASFSSTAITGDTSIKDLLV